MSSAPSSKCEVKASCSESASCQITRNITVNPGLKIPPNCAINVRTKGNIHTWQQAKQQIGGSKGSLDLVLQEKGKSKSGKYICQCTAVHFTRKQLLINPLGPCSCLICIYRCSTLIKKKNCKLCLQMFNHLCCSFELNSASLHLAKCLRSLELWTWLEMGFVLGKRKQLCRLLVTC